MTQDLKITKLKDKLQEYESCHRYRQELAKMYDLLDKGKPFFLSFDGNHFEIIETEKS